MGIYAPSITDDSTPPLGGNEQMLSWASPNHPYSSDCWLEVPSRGNKAKLMADIGNDLEIEGDVFAAKRPHEDDDTSCGENDGTSGTSASTESGADVVPEKRRRRVAHHTPRHQERIIHLLSFI